MEKAPKQKDVFKVFSEPFVHKSGTNFYECRIDTCYAVVQWRWGDDNIQSFQESSQGQHAEKNIVKTLKEKIGQKVKSQDGAPKPKVVVKIYISLSPCSDCSEEVIRFTKRTDLDVQMDVSFPSLYKIKRRSCLNSPETCSGHLKYIDQEESNGNTKGLQRMAQAGITLRTFRPEDWITLADELNVKNDELIVFLKAQKAAQGTLTLDNCIFRAEDAGVSREIKDRLKDRLKEDKRMAEDLSDIIPMPGAGAGAGGAGEGGAGEDGAGPEPDEGGVEKITKMMKGSSIGEEEK